MLLLHRYLLREFLRAWSLIFLTLAIVTEAIDIFTRLRRDAANPLPLGKFAAYLLLHFGQMLLILVPIATLMAAILSLGLMSKRHELLAMRTAGLAPWRIVLPLVLFGILSSSLLAAANWTVIPVATRQAELIRDSQLPARAKKALFGQNRVWLQVDRQRLMNIQLVHPTLAVLHGVTIYRLAPDFSLEELTEAASIEYREGQWWIAEGTRWRFQPDRSVVTEALHRTPVDLNKNPSDFRDIVLDPDEVDGPQLAQYIDQLRRSGLASARYEINYYAKLAVPASSALLMLIGVALGMRYGRGPQVAQNVAAAIMISIVYALAHAYAVASGLKGLLDPPAAAWLANGVLLLAGIGLLSRMR
ncbi:MAG: LPS export ABC transporter permease LptG [Nitrospirota bacterium]